MEIVHIEPPTEQEIAEYKQAKREEFLKSFRVKRR